MKLDILKIANKKFKSRLIVGTGKYKNMKECAKAIKLSGADIVTVPVSLAKSEKSKLIPVPVGCEAVILICPPELKNHLAASPDANVTVCVNVRPFCHELLRVAVSAIVEP